MSAAEYLGMYAEGWTKGDASKIMRASSEEYILDDPNVGKITNGEFAEYRVGVKETVRSLLNGDLPEPFLELTEVVTQEGDGLMTASPGGLYRVLR